jgi:hypothetical protein
MFLSIIPPEHIVNHLATATKYLKEVEYLLEPRGKVSDLLSDCIASHAVLWGVFDTDRDGDPLVAVLVTKVTSFWRCKTLELIALAGEHGSMKEWIAKMNLVTEAYAQENGCSLRVVPAGRPEWERYLAKFGFKRTGLVTLECPVGRQERR